MERNSKCKLCFQIFTDGFALRNHMMRFHSIAASSLTHPTESYSSLTSEEESESKGGILARERFKWLDPEVNRTWKTELTRVKRTKPSSNESRIPKLDSFSSDKDVALCLMMLSKDSTGLKQKRVYKCPFCERVFGSGQAFGGHKKSHFLPLSVRRRMGFADSKECLVAKKISGFDLNLPAASMEEDSTIDSQ